MFAARSLVAPHGPAAAHTPSPARRPPRRYRGDTRSVQLGLGPWRAAAVTAMVVASGLSQAAPTYTLGGIMRKHQGPQARVVSLSTVTGPDASWHDGTNWINAFTESVISSHFSAARDHGTFTSGVVASEQNPRSLSPGHADATGRSLVYDDLVSFTGVTAITTVTVGYSFWSAVQLPPEALASFQVESVLTLGLSMLPPGHTGAVGTPQFKRSYRYAWDQGGYGGASATAPTVRLDGQDIDDDRRVFSYTGSVTLGLAPGWQLGITGTGASSSAQVNARVAESEIVGASIENRLDFWIEGFGDPLVRVGSALSGANYAPVTAVPEPASALLMALGLIAAPAWVRRRRARTRV